MEWRQIVIESYDRAAQVLERTLKSLTVEDLDYLPDPGSNSIGWLAWHLTRCQDRSVAELTGEEQIWIKNGWYERFGGTRDPKDWGLGDTPEQVAAFKSPAVDTIMGYHHDVLKRTKAYVGALSEADISRTLEHPRYKNVGMRLAGIIGDNLQHAGQAAYVRGLLKGRGWMDA
ncbi:MAG: DinB family protein [Dehalococcoidia bacterium]|nr:DinB family protein [Dehalococcoidia bacterium]MDZ4247206.1 DinB family protein [Dehalococcoidia bacterium]